jgi:endo-1,4-beta-xylanase
VADKFVKYCEQNQLKVLGHCLVWHSQAPDWWFTAGYNASPVSKELLKERLVKHIKTVVGHFKGQVHGWDVVNEAIEDDGSFRKSPFFNLLGEEFIEIAFRAAHEADPDVELYYNDFSMAGPAKREAVCRLVRSLKAKGLRIDGVGMQSHNGLDYPNLQEYEKSIDAFAACGVKVMITELDINVLPNPQGFGGANVEQNFEFQQKYNPYADGLPKDVEKQLSQRWLDLFNIYYKHRSQISRINLWGISDGGSWLNGWPIAGRTNYPLLFDRQYMAKPVVQEIIKLYK